MRGNANQYGLKTMAGLVFCLTLVLCWSLPVAGGGKKSDSEVKLSAKATKPDETGKQVITVTMNINKGWHAYANPVGNADLRSSQTVITVTGKEKVNLVKVAYPEGKVVNDKVIGNYRTYEGQVNIPVTVQRAKGDTGPLEVAVRFMVCQDKEGVCLLPATVKLPVK